MSEPIQAALRSLPAVGRLVEHETLAPWLEKHGSPALTAASRKAVAAARKRILEHGETILVSDVVTHVQEILDSSPRPFQEVLNATGVILHTNLGRAPIANVVWEAMGHARGYCDLEFDLESGKRGSRLRGVSAPLTALTGAEAGMVVNNCAAALLLMVAGLAEKKPTAISRGQIVEIGGGFRLPRMMQATGSELMEIGTTNRTHLYDYEDAAQQGAGLLLAIHRSNFSVEGFVTEPKPEDIVTLGHAHNIPVVMDLGSGCMVDTQPYGLPQESTVQSCVKLGFDAVAFSGDKLLGGPQAGYIVGKHAVIEKLKKNPLARALRCDKLQLAGAITTLELYLQGKAENNIPILQFMEQTQDELRSRCLAWQSAWRLGEVVQTADAAGGGTMPGGELPGFAVALPVKRPDEFLARLRALSTPIIAHIVQDRVLLHPRTVSPKSDPLLVSQVQQLLALESPAQ